jgi:hypothetical protein
MEKRIFVAVRRKVIAGKQWRCAVSHRQWEKLSEVRLPLGLSGMLHLAQCLQKHATRVQYEGLRSPPLLRAFFQHKPMHDRFGQLLLS